MCIYMCVCVCVRVNVRARMFVCACVRAHARGCAQNFSRYEKLAWCMIKHRLMFS